MLTKVRDDSQPSDRLAAALAELVDAIREEIASASASTRDEPVELLSPAMFAARSGLGRSTVYLGIADGSIRSALVRSRRLIPSTEIGRLAAAASAPRSKKAAPAIETPDAATEERHGSVARFALDSLVLASAARLASRELPREKPSDRSIGKS